MQVAAGPGYLVEMVNLAERVWRTGGDAAQPVLTRDLPTFFGSGSARLTDPRVLFDAASGRWFASVSNVDASTVLLAVSQGADPTDAWTVNSLAAKGCADQPRLGLADGTVVVAADIFADCDRGGAAPLGGELWIVNKQQLVDGSTKAASTTYGPAPGLSSLSPVQSLSPTPTEYVVTVDDRASRVVHLLAVDGVPPDDVQVRELAQPAINVLSRPPVAGQPPTRSGLRPPIATNDNRVLDSVWENGRLWLSANNRCVPGGDSLIRACARIVELSTETRTVTWDADLAYAGAHVFYPALRPDGAGNLVIVAGESGQKVLPQLIAVGRTPDGTFTKPVVIARSAGTYRGDRYGDYFGAARDPLNPAVVWVAGEAGTDVPSGSGWSTSVASVVVTAAGAIPPVVAGIAPPGVRALGSAVRVGASVRLAYRALDDGAAVRTVVTVRDARKAVVYSTTTPSATFHVEQRYFVLWPAKHARGRFSYCVSSLSQSGLPSPPSCAAFTLR